MPIPHELSRVYASLCTRERVKCIVFYHCTVVKFDSFLPPLPSAARSQDPAGLRLYLIYKEVRHDFPGNSFVIDPKTHPPDSFIALVFDPYFGRKDVKKRDLEYFFMPVGPKL
jgi:hypothetical protein